MNTPSVGGAFAYADGVLAGRVSACRLVRLACQRLIDDLAHAEAREGDRAFRAELAEKPMRFTSLLPNIKGPLAGKPLELMGWQQFLFANLFGFVEHEAGARRFRQGVVFVPRGGGMTSIAAPLAL